MKNNIQKTKLSESSGLDSEKPTLNSEKFENPNSPKGAKKLATGEVKQSKKAKK